MTDSRVKKLWVAVTACIVLAVVALVVIRNCAAPQRSASIKVEVQRRLEKAQAEKKTRQEVESELSSMGFSVKQDSAKTMARLDFTAFVPFPVNHEVRVLLDYRVDELIRFEVLEFTTSL